MATISRHGKGWRAQIRRKGFPVQSKTFPLRKYAEGWAAQRETEIISGKLGILPKHSLSEAITRFLTERWPRRQGGRWERNRLRAFLRDPIARHGLGSLGKAQITEWKDRRLLEVSGASVRREMGLLGAVLSAAVEWGWVVSNPLRDVSKPPPSPARRRGLSQSEIDGVVSALGYVDLSSNLSHEVAIAFLLAIETGMRAGEILSLTWPNVHESYVHLPKTKNGEPRDVPLSLIARGLIQQMRPGLKQVFSVDNATRDKLFRDARKRAGLSGFTFHDSRSEAISRLAKKLGPLELARMVGHRDIKSLMQYFHSSPEEIAGKLG